MSKYKVVAVSGKGKNVFWLLEDDEMYYVIKEQPNPEMLGGGVFASPCWYVAACWLSRYDADWDMDVGNKVLPMSVVNRLHAAKEIEAFKILIKNQKERWPKKTLNPT